MSAWVSDMKYDRKLKEANTNSKVNLLFIHCTCKLMWMFNAHERCILRSLQPHIHTLRAPREQKCALLSYNYHNATLTFTIHCSWIKTARLQTRNMFKQHKCCSNLLFNHHDSRVECPGYGRVSFREHSSHSTFTRFAQNP